MLTLALSVLTVPSTARAQIFARATAIENARIVTMDGRTIEQGTLLLRGGKIVALGANVKPPLLTRKIDARGATVTPGLIDVDSTLGLADPSGAGALRRAEDAFDRYDTAALDEALRNGVTAVFLAPRGNAGIQGTAAVVRLARDEKRPEAIGEVLRGEAALCLDIGAAGSPLARLGAVTALAKQFDAAKAYRQSLEDYEEDLAEYKKKLKERAEKKKADAKKSGGEKKPAAEQKPAEKEPPGEQPEKKETDGSHATAEPRPRPRPTPQPTPQPADDAKPSPEKPAEKKDDELKKPQHPGRKPDMLILLKAIDHELPVRIRAYRSEDILNALELAKQFSLEVILEGATEAHLVADEIAEAKVHVVLGSAAFDATRRDDVYRRAIRRQGAVLSAAGIRWLAGSGESAPAARFVLQNTLLASAALPDADPLKAVTADAADALQVGDQIGRLRPGMLADLVLWSGDPLDPASKVLRVFVGGDSVYEAGDTAKKGGTP